MTNFTTTPRMMAAAKEFNVGTSTLLDFLASKGFDISNLMPTSKISEAMYRELQTEFYHDKIIKQKSERVVLVKSGDFDNFSESSTLSIENKRTLGIINKCLSEKNAYLELGNCGLSDTDFALNSTLDILLRKCTHLKTLIICENWWSEISIDKWIQTEEKSINNGPPNKLTKIPEFVGSLLGLQKFIFSKSYAYTQRYQFSLKIISSLINLEYLDLSSNFIQSIGKSFSKLNKLKNLDISSNKIKKLDFLSNSIALEFLNFSNNKISGLKEIENLKNLKLIYGSNNLIQNLSPIKNLMSLKCLILTSNHINNVLGLDNLLELELLDLIENKILDIKDFEFILKMKPGFRLLIAENPLAKKYQLKLEVGENHLPFIKELLLRRVGNSQMSSLTYPIKVLMLGNHASGKSSMVNYLTEKVNKGSTHILRIENYEIKDAEMNVLPNAIFFDFGGQDFYHGLYQAFISPGAIQIIMFDSKRDKNEITKDDQEIPIINFNRSFWLGQKNYQENESLNFDPYIIVQSYAETETEEAPPLDYKRYRGYKKTFFLSLASDLLKEQKKNEKLFQIGREYFKEYFNNIILNLQHISYEPDWYIYFLKYIIYKEDKNHKPTSLESILSYYKIQLPKEEALESLKTNLVNLHRHGLVMYYPQIKELEDIVWLNPELLVKYIQEKILTKEFFEKKYETPGIIPKTEFESIVNDRLILLLLKEQKVVFLHNPTRKEQDQEYILPNYLPILNKGNSDSQLFTFGLSNSSFVIKFNDYIPFGFINQMICFFGKQPDIKKFWRNQLLFTLHKEARILIELDFENLMISVYIHLLYKSTTLEEKIKEYIYSSMLQLYWNIKSEQIMEYDDFLNYKKQQEKNEVEINAKYQFYETFKNGENYVPKDAFISLDKSRFVSCLDLFQSSENDFKIYSYGLLENQINELDLKEISVKPFEVFTNKNFLTMKRVFVSYSKFDEEYLQEFEDHMVTLKQEGVATFNCRKIEFGKEWDEEIKKEIDECDIMICLISVKFLNTDYINKIEISKAIEQNKIIIPIIIKACDWENSTLGKYQAAQRGKIVALDNNLRLDGRIKSYTPEERAAFWTDIIKEFRQKKVFK